MFKISSKSFNQQRATLKPVKNSAIFEETEEDDEDDEIMINEEDDIFLEDGSSSCYSSGIAAGTGYQDTRNETMLLAQFLSSTGPEEYLNANHVAKNGDSKAQQQFKRASRLLSRLRKRPTMPVLRSGQQQALEQQPPIKRNHIPLPVYEAPESNNITTATNTNTTTSSTTVTAKSSPTLPKISTTPVNTTTTATNTTTSYHHSSNNNNHNYNNKSNRKSTNSTTTLSPMQLRDSGIYSETASERDSSVVSSTTYASTIPMPPLPHFLNDLQQFPQPPYAGNKSPRRPAPMPAAMASAAIAACSPSSVVSTSTVRSVPEAALKRRSVRLRHVQVQTETGTNTDDTVLVSSVKSQIEDKQACPHCRQIVTTTSNNGSNRIRRPSCPPALSSGAILPATTTSTTTADLFDNDDEQTDAKKLLAMIMNLKSQLAEEKQCRLKLEKAMYQRQSEDRREMLAKEKDRWAGDCLWLNDRIALLPE